MRTVRLGREFDAVFVHDAVMYMTTEEDLRLAIETAFVHCRPGGAALFAPDHVRETSAPAPTTAATTATGAPPGSWSGPGTPTRSTPPTPSTTPTCCASADGSVRVEHDRHVEGLFPRATWLRLLAEAGFEARALPVEHSELEPGSYELFVATRPHG